MMDQRTAEATMDALLAHVHASSAGHDAFDVLDDLTPVARYESASDSSDTPSRRASDRMPAGSRPHLAFPRVRTPHLGIAALSCSALMLGLLRKLRSQPPEHG